MAPTNSSLRAGAALSGLSFVCSAAACLAFVTQSESVLRAFAWSTATQNDTSMFAGINSILRSTGDASASSLYGASDCFAPKLCNGCAESYSSTALPAMMAVVMLTLSFNSQLARISGFDSRSHQQVSTATLAASAAAAAAAIHSFWTSCHSIASAEYGAEVGPGFQLMVLAAVNAAAAAAVHYVTPAAAPASLLGAGLLEPQRKFAPSFGGFGSQVRRGVPIYADAPATGTGPGLDYNPDKYSDDANAGNFRKLGQALEDADVERRKDEEAALKREQAAEFARQERKRKIEYMVDMDDQAPSGTVNEFMYKGGVQEILDKLEDDLVGLKPVKDRVAQIASLLVVDKMRRKLGFDTSVPSLHMCFTGAPGTGKTTVAVRMGQILARMGYVRQGHVVVATRDDLVGQYVGHTAPKTKEVIKKAMGGVLLIDEAYYLYNASNDRDYGQESIEILLQVMENNADDLVVVFAGYKDRMDTFFSYIPGLNSRVGNHIDFPNYEIEELVDISRVMARDLEYELTEEAADVFKSYITRRMQMPYFSNARTVRNAMDRARMNAAIRIFNSGIEGGQVTVGDLKKLEAPDFQILLDEALAADDDAILA